MEPVRLTLREVRLERFKAAFKPEPIGLGMFNVVIGRNGSGKSTLVEALQWLDTTVRQDARVACDRYHGIHDLVNLRTRTKPTFFAIGITWAAAERTETLDYHIKVAEADDQITPEIVEETCLVTDGSETERLIWTEKKQRRVRVPNTTKGTAFSEPDRVALARAAGLAGDDWYFPALQSFWRDAVFLRLSTSQLARGSPSRRKSHAPLLDEEGNYLPALLAELTPEQIGDLVDDVQTILRDIEGVDVSKPANGRDELVHYSLKERMPSKGRSGRTLFSIPAWMLSEGTRRITALLALLHHDPLPSLLCVEEIENGLDPWTVIAILRHLQSAASKGVQILVTTHSPWLLDHVPADSIIDVIRKEGETTYTRFKNRTELRGLLDRLPPGAVYTESSLLPDR